MSKIQQPVQSIKMTNVAIVRYKVQGKRFEIACYKNKVMNWRNKIEKDLNEVLQSNYVFTNVSKGVSANNNDLLACFGTTDFVTIACEILAKGDLQVSEKERQTELESAFKDIASIISEKCINRETRRPFSIGMIERAMRELHFSVKRNRTNKQQALELTRTLKQVLPTIERAQMRVKVDVALHHAKALKPKLLALAASVEHEEYTASHLELSLLIDPGAYRAIEELLAREARGKFVLDILDLKVQMEGEAALEKEEAERESHALGLDQLPEHDERKAGDGDDDADELAERAASIRIGGGDNDSDDDRRSKRGKGKKGAAAAAAANTGDTDEDTGARKGKKAKKAKKSKASAPNSEDEGPRMAAPKKKKAAAQRKKAAAAAAAAHASSSSSDSDSASEEEVAPPPKSKGKAAPKRVSSSDESSSASSDDAPPAKSKPAAKAKAKAASSSDSSDSDSDAAPRKAKGSAASAAPAKKAPPVGKKKKARGSDSEEDIRVPNQSQIDAEEAEAAAAEAAAKATAKAAKKSAKEAGDKKKGKKGKAAVDSD